MVREGNINKNEESAKVLATSFIRRFLAVYDTYHNVENLKERKEEFIANIKDRMLGIADTNENIANKLLAIIEKEKDEIIEPTSKWVENLALKLSEEIVKFFSLNELEEKFKEFNLKKSNNLELNRLFTYKINNEGKLLSLHSPIIFENNPVKIKKLIEDGMSVLSEKLKTEPGLREIEKIEAKSTIFFDHPDLLENYGFEVTEKEEASKIYTVTVSKNKFLNILEKE